MDNIPDELIKDTNILRKNGYDLELIQEDRTVYIKFKDFPLVLGLYNLAKTNLLILTTIHYPNTGFDMFWTDPKLVLKDGVIPKQATCVEPHLGEEWRRFSYHPYNNNRWNPADHDIKTFIAYVHQRLQRGD